ncbi:MAG TPA: preprotein translocase subunit SecA, partial [Bacteroidota bacterium]|nr:preprotein translocase subunit SecA [Bacteroidota bacterium]
MLQFLRKLFGSKHERDIKALLPLVAEINKHFEQLQGLTDEQLRAKTDEFRARIKEATREIEEEIAAAKEEVRNAKTYDEREALYARIDELNKELDATIESTLNELLPEAFAVVKDACRRLVGKSWEVAGNKVVWDMVP